MRKYLYSFLLMAFILSLGACKKNYYTRQAPAVNVADTNATVKYTGIFANGPYGTAYGRANISLQEGKYSLVFLNDIISDGPDLHVYLSKELSPVNFLDLGNLKTLSGTQVYDISGSPDFGQYKYVLIYSRAYDHLFGSARLS
jgi:Electron transfer DM13